MVVEEGNALKNVHTYFGRLHIDPCLYVFICSAINGEWSNWSNWGSCNASCAGGTQTRSRSCNNPSPSSNGGTCNGSTTDFGTCNPQCCRKILTEKSAKLVMNFLSFYKFSIMEHIAICCQANLTC